jgi:hypothetical protein
MTSTKRDPKRRDGTGLLGRLLGAGDTLSTPGKRWASRRRPTEWAGRRTVNRGRAGLVLRARQRCVGTLVERAPGSHPAQLRLEYYRRHHNDVETNPPRLWATIKPGPAANSDTPHFREWPDPNWPPGSLERVMREMNRRTDLQAPLVPSPAPETCSWSSSPATTITDGGPARRPPATTPGVRSNLIA